MVILVWSIRKLLKNISGKDSYRRSQWPRGLRRRSAAARLLRSWVRIPLWAWMFVCCECYVLSGRALCDELITRPEESYRLWCVVVCNLETSWMRRLWPTGGYCAKKKVSYQREPWSFFSIKTERKFNFNVGQACRAFKLVVMSETVK